LPGELDVFLNPESVAVIGATERPGSWGSFIMQGLLSLKFGGRIYPVNRHAEEVFGIPAFGDIAEIDDSIDLAVVAIPEQFVEETISACGRKGVKGITLITSGFGEISKAGKARQDALAGQAHSYGMRLLGPNVSGTFNLQAGFNASATPGGNLLATPIAAACQGGYAFYDILSSGGAKGLGVGKFIHTGNESDLTVTDFFDVFGRDPEVKVIVMYIEAIRDGRRFLEIAQKITPLKPVIVYKAGRTKDSARAAQSHTGALAGSWKLYQGLLRQAGVIICPAMELLLPMGMALVERPPMRGTRTGIITVGGSWGVALTDALGESGLSIPEFSSKLQKKLRLLGLPSRSSTKNPVDFGASGMFLATDMLLSIGREILVSDEVDALILHGVGRPGMHSQDTPEELRFFVDIEKQQIRRIQSLEDEFTLPVCIGSHYNPWESQVVSDLNQQKIRIYNRLYEMAQILYAMYCYAARQSAIFG